ncbi:phage tail tape measure protein, partial [Escherichia coli]|uniref:phage tail tape measure protein n=1 Tax=Escherichia coli TaxID=562 RepID=UPI003A4DA487
HTDCPLTDFGGKTSIFSHPVYLFLRKFSLQDSRGGSYSNTIVDTPTYFAFAKGAGLMGEAGPEAIMPLTRAADGSLGVRAIGDVNGGGGFVYSPVYHISIQNQGSNGEIDARSARGLVDLIDSRVVSIMQSSRRDGGLYSA